MELDFTPDSTVESPPLGAPPPLLETEADNGCGCGERRPEGGGEAEPCRCPAKPEGGVPVTDGTPAPCRQKNAEEYLRGRSQGVMAQYADGLFGLQQHTESASPAPDEAEQAVIDLAEWREDSPYG